MPAILLRLTDADREAVRAAADRAGLRQAEFCRRAVLRMANDGDACPEAMLREVLGILKRQNGRELPQEAADAVAALVKAGMGQDVARRRVRAAVEAEPKAQAADLIVAALRQGD